MKTEKFYVIEQGCDLYTDYFEYKDSRKNVMDLFKEFAEKHNIEASQFVPGINEIAIVPTESDNEQYGSQMTKARKDGLRFFKKSSKLFKDWVSMITERGFKIHKKPMVGLYFTVLDKHSTRLFDKEGVLYCSISSEQDFKPCKGAREIKGSEFYMAIES